MCAPPYSDPVSRKKEPTYTQCIKSNRNCYLLYKEYRRASVPSYPGTTQATKAQVPPATADPPPTGSQWAPRYAWPKPITVRNHPGSGCLHQVSRGKHNVPAAVVNGFGRPSTNNRFTSTVSRQPQPHRRGRANRLVGLVRSAAPGTTPAAPQGISPPYPAAPQPMAQRRVSTSSQHVPRHPAPQLTRQSAPPTSTNQPNQGTLEPADTAQPTRTRHRTQDKDAPHVGDEGTGARGRGEGTKRSNPQKNPAI